MGRGCCLAIRSHWSLTLCIVAVLQVSNLGDLADRIGVEPGKTITFKVPTPPHVDRQAGQPGTFACSHLLPPLLLRVVRGGWLVPWCLLTVRGFMAAAGAAAGHEGGADPQGDQRARREDYRAIAG